MKELCLRKLVFSWNQVTAKDWRTALDQAPVCALQQEWGYGQAIRDQGHDIHHASLSYDGKIVALAQIAERHLMGPLRIALLMRGPIWTVPHDAELESAFIAQIRHRLKGSVLLWTPDRPYQPEIEGSLLGYRRVLTGYSTILLDLKPEIEQIKSKLNGKWRNLMRAGQRTELEVNLINGGKKVEWLIASNEAYRERIGYAGPSPDFIKMLGHFSKPGRRKIWVAQAKGEPIAGIIVQIHGRCATYYAGCTSEAGRKMRAHHLLLWQAIRELKSDGVNRFDLGGIDTEKAAGVARFKLGMGGEAVTLAGTYLVPPQFGVKNQEGPQLPAALPDCLESDKAA